MVYLLQLLDSDDELYYIVDVGLWGIGEITAGFLILGIPGLPAVVQTVKSSTSFTTLISRFRGTTAPSQSDPSSERPSIRTWGQGSRRKRRGLWEISDLDTYGLVSVRAQAASSETMPGDAERERPPNAILRETRVDVEHGERSWFDQVTPESQKEIHRGLDQEGPRRGEV